MESRFYRPLSMKKKPRKRIRLIDICAVRNTLSDTAFKKLLGNFHQRRLSEAEKYYIEWRMFLQNVLKCSIVSSSL